MSLDFVRTRPPRCSLVNAATGESIECQFNPTELRQKLAVNWTRQAVVGLGHQPLQFQNTSNPQLIGVEFYSTEDSERFREFLGQLTQPAGPGMPPPSVLVVWPNVVSVEAVVLTVDVRLTQFSSSGEVQRSTATLNLEVVAAA